MRRIVRRLGIRAIPAIRTPGANVLLALMACMLIPAHALGQAPPEPLHRKAVQAAGGDTLRAIATLRVAVREAPRDLESLLALGTLLARTAPTAERDFVQRQEAEALLNRVLRLRTNHPAALVELALLKRKQNIRRDARRLLETATDSRNARDMHPGLLAEAHFQLGDLLQEEAEDFANLVFLPTNWRMDGDPGDGANGDVSPICPAGVEYFCLNYFSPGDFNRQFLNARPASDRWERELPRIEAAYRSALSHDPAHPEANRALLGLLHGSGRMDEFILLARRFAGVAPEEPFPHLFVGLAWHEAQAWNEAEAAFERGIALLPEGERTAYSDVSMLLTSARTEAYQGADAALRREVERVLWARSDPLYLVDANERRLEHIARVAWAELYYGAPRLGVPGWQSDRGLIYIRYGRPEHVWALQKDRGRRVGDSQVADPGRWILWNYGLDQPSFIFHRQLGYRNVSFDHEANAATWAATFAEDVPSTFTSQAVERWVDIPAQLVRFRGADPAEVDVVAYAEVPVPLFEVGTDGKIETALFVFTPLFEDSARLGRTLDPQDSGNLLFSLPLLAGNYEYSIEALAPKSAVAGRTRGSLQISPFAGGSLEVSDLLVGQSVRPRIAEPKRWRDFDIAAKRDLSFESDEPIHLYFEIYGLVEDEAGTGSYTVDIVIEDAGQRSVVGRIAQTLGSVIGRGAEGTRLSFERTAMVHAGVVPDYVSLLLEGASHGEYRVRLTVGDRRGGEPVEVQRLVRLRPPEK